MSNIVKVVKGRLLENPGNLEGHWMTSEDVGLLLEYKDPRRGSLKIFERNKSKFVNEIDTSVVRLTTKAGDRWIRIFSERGSLKMARFSGTKKSDEIMERVFDVFLQVRREKEEKAKKPVIHSIETKKLELQEKQLYVSSLQSYAGMLCGMGLNDSALAVHANVAEYMGFSEAKALLPALDASYYTPTQISQMRDSLTAQRVGIILSKLGLHGRNDPNKNHSQPFKDKAKHCNKDIIAYRYKKWVVDRVLKYFDDNFKPVVKDQEEFRFD